MFVAGTYGHARTNAEVTSMSCAPACAGAYPHGGVPLDEEDVDVEELLVEELEEDDAPLDVLDEEELLDVEELLSVVVVVAPGAVPGPEPHPRSRSTARSSPACLMPRG